jgi:hypothetical protein
VTGSIIFSSDAIEDMMTSEPESCLGRHRVTSLADMRRVLETLVPAEQPRTLDLIGHSTRDAKLLRLGKTVVDMADVRIAQFFERLAGEHLARLQIVAIRLLGCETAVEVVGQKTIRSLTRLVGVKVYGTRKMITKTHYKPDGFDETFADIALVEASYLPNPSRRL